MRIFRNLCKVETSSACKTKTVFSWNTSILDDYCEKITQYKNNLLRMTINYSAPLSSKDLPLYSIRLYVQIPTNLTSTKGMSPSLLPALLFSAYNLQWSCNRGCISLSFRLPLPPQLRHNCFTRSLQKPLYFRASIKAFVHNKYIMSFTCEAKSSN